MTPLPNTNGNSRMKDELKIKHRHTAAITASVVHLVEYKYVEIVNLEPLRQIPIGGPTELPLKIVRLNKWHTLVPRDDFLHDFKKLVPLGFLAPIRIFHI